MIVFTEPNESMSDGCHCPEQEYEVLCLLAAIFILNMYGIYLILSNNFHIYKLVINLIILFTDCPRRFANNHPSWNLTTPCQADSNLYE